MHLFLLFLHRALSLPFVIRLAIDCLSYNFSQVQHDIKAVGLQEHLSFHQSARSNRHGLTSLIHQKTQILAAQQFLASYAFPQE